MLGRSKDQVNAPYRTVDNLTEGQWEGSRHSHHQPDRGVVDQNRFRLPSEIGEGKVFEEWVGENALFGLEVFLCRGRRKGSALRKPGRSIAC
jgi:hypothetical protein